MISYHKSLSYFYVKKDLPKHFLIAVATLVLVMKERIEVFHENIEAKSLIGKRAEHQLSWTKSMLQIP